MAKNMENEAAKDKAADAAGDFNQCGNDAGCQECSDRDGCADFSPEGECTGCMSGSLDDEHEHKHEPRVPAPACRIFESDAFKRLTGNMIRPGGFDITDEAMNFCGFDPGSRILDVGCGRGATVEHIQKEYGVAAEGIDLSEELISQGIKRNPSLNIKVGDGIMLDYSSYTFDGVMMECVLSLMDNFSEALHEAYCVLKKGGKLILSDLYLKGDKKGHPFTQGQLLEALDEIGYKVVLWEEKSSALLSLTAQIIMEFGTMEAFMQEVYKNENDENMDDPTVAAFSGAKLGYFLLVAEKE